MPLAFDTKSPDANIIYGGDFSAQLAERPSGTTVDAGLVNCAVAQAIGAEPNTLGLQGAAFLSGTSVVSQMVTGGQAGAVYTLEFKAPLSNGETLVGTINLPVGIITPP